MIARFTPCDRDLLRQVLRDDLDTIDQQHLESHLTTCDMCRSELERLAGGEDWLSDVREHLSSSEVPAYGGEQQQGKQPGCFGAAGLLGHHHDHDEIDDRLNFLDPSADPQKLGRLGAYEVESVIGRGGMGIVLKAFDTALNRHVAIKVLAAELATSGAARRRFARESQAAAAIAHEHVVAIHAVDNSGKLPFLVMPYIPGKSLQERLDESGPLEIKEVLRIGLQAAAGLAAAHAQGLVHRDIKPANILLENDIERVRITDFGLARAVDDASQTQSGFIAGTPQYMAPEQARGEPVDHRADLFSLGSVMYAMCTGRPPFRAETTFAVLRRICEDTPRPLRETNPDVPDWLQAIISKLHSRDPRERFQTAAEVASVLEQYLAHLQQPMTNPLPKFHQSLLPWRNQRRTSQLRLALWSVSGAALVGMIIWASGMVSPHNSNMPRVPVGMAIAPDVPQSTASAATTMNSGGSPPSMMGSAGGSGMPSPQSRPRIDPWEAWENELVEIEGSVRQLEESQNSRVSIGAPIDQRQEIREVSGQLEAIEEELNTRTTTVKSKH